MIAETVIAVEKQLRNPYVGPSSFQEDDQAYFKGRGNETNELLALLTARRLVLLYAQSGAGKTSLINAGLIPKLRTVQGGFELLPVGRVGDSVLVDVEVKNVFSFNLMVSMETGMEPERLATLSLNDFLLNLAIDEEGCYFVEGEEEEEEEESFEPLRPRALIIDQFEEIFTKHPTREQSRILFFMQLAEAMRADPHLYVLLSMREDYYAQITPYVDYLPDSLRTRYYMQRMRRAAAIEAVKTPARMAKRPFAQGVAEELVTHLLMVRREDGLAEGRFVEPLQLQVVCTQLWQQLEDDDVIEITLDDVKREAEEILGGSSESEPLSRFIENALAGYYEQSIQGVLDQAEIDVDESKLREWFTSELISENGIRMLVHRDREKGETAGISETIVSLLDEKHHLVRNDSRGGRPFIELVHDSFVAPIQQSNQQWREKQAQEIYWFRAAYLYAKTQDPTLLLKSSELEKAQEQVNNLSNLPVEVEKFLEDSHNIQNSRTIKNRTRVALLSAVIAIVAVGLVIWATSQTIDLQKALDENQIIQGKLNIALLDAQQKTEDAETARDEEEEAKEEAEQAKEVAEAESDRALIAENRAQSLQFASQSQLFVEEGNTVGGLLLAIEAFQKFEEVKNRFENEVEKSITEDVIHGSLLSALYHHSTSDNNSFLQQLPLDSAQPFPSLILIDHSIWNLNTLQEVEIDQFLKKRAIAHISISQDSSTLLLIDSENNVARISHPHSQLNVEFLQTQEFVFVDFLLENEVEIKDAKLNLDGTKLALVLCEKEQNQNNTASTTDCQLQIWQWNDDGRLERSPTNCDSFPVEGNIAALAFLANDLHLIWSTTVLKGEDQVFNDVYLVNFNGTRCQTIVSPLPTSQNVLGMDYMVTDYDSDSGVLITANPSFIHWWRVRSGEEDIQISQIGPPIPNPSANSAIYALPELDAFLSVSEDDTFSLINANIKNWPDIACRSAGRNLSIAEWNHVFPTTNNINEVSLDEYATCPHIQGNNGYGLDTSFVYDKLLEAEKELERCSAFNLSRARTHFGDALQLENLVDERAISFEQFEQWGAIILLTHFMESNNSLTQRCRNLFEDLLNVGFMDSNTLQSQSSLYEIIRGINELKEQNYPQNLNSMSFSEQNQFEKEIENLIGDAEGLTITELRDQIISFLTVEYSLFCHQVDIDGYSDGCRRIFTSNVVEIEHDDIVFSSTNEDSVYAIQANEGDLLHITLEATDNELDPILILRDEDWNSIANNDDSNGTLNSELNEIVRQDGGVIYIQALSYGESGGRYKLMVEQLTPTTLEFDVGINSNTENVFWVIEAEVGSLLTISLDATDEYLDPVLELFDSFGNSLIVDDDGGGFPNALIRSFLIRQTGRYYIKATGIGGFGGSYLIRVSEEQPSNLSFAQSVQSTSFDKANWQFEGQAGQSVTINLESTTDSFDPHLTLLGPDGIELISDDDSGDGPNGYDARIEGFILPEDGRYIIIAGRPGSSERYTLTLQLDP